MARERAARDLETDVVRVAIEIDRHAPSRKSVGVASRQNGGGAQVREHAIEARSERGSNEKQMRMTQVRQIVCAAHEDPMTGDALLLVSLLERRIDGRGAEDHQLEGSLWVVEAGVGRPADEARNL